MAKRLSLGLAVFLAATLAAGAGDIAQFVNLGFSADSKYFMFGQYGVLQKTSTPWDPLASKSTRTSPSTSG